MATTKDSKSTVDESTKEELYEQAQDLDIEGRSMMTKAELADAVDDAPPAVPEPSEADKASLEAAARNAGLA